MGVLVSDPLDKIAYYQAEAAKLRRQARDVRRQTGDIAESARLRDLAEKADEAAESLRQQLESMES